MMLFLTLYSIADSIQVYKVVIVKQYILVNKS